MDFSELYLTYYSKPVRFAKEFVILEEDAENITQDVFTDLWAKRDSMDRIENMNAYLFRLIKNRCLDHLKHKMFEQKYIESVQTSFEIEMSLKLQSLIGLMCLISRKEMKRKCSFVTQSIVCLENVVTYFY